MKKLFHGAAVAAAIGLVLTLAACANDSDNDDSKESESAYTTLTMTMPANTYQVRVYRKSGDDDFINVFYQTSSSVFTTGETVTFTDYFTTVGTKYTYRYRCRIGNSSSYTNSDYSEEVTVTAAKGEGEIAVTGASASYNADTGVFTIESVPTVTTTLPAGFTDTRTYLYFYNPSNSNVYKNITDATTLNLKTEFAQKAAFKDVPLTPKWIIRTKSSDGCYYFSAPFAGTTYGLPESITVPDEKLAATINADGIPSFTIDIPAGTKGVSVYRKGGSLSAYGRNVFYLFAGDSGTSEAAIYNFTDPFVANGTAYTYCYRTISTADVSVYSSDTPALTPTAGSGELLTSGGVFSYDSSTGVLTSTTTPSVTPTTAPSSNMTRGIVLYLERSDGTSATPNVSNGSWDLKAYFATKDDWKGIPLTIKTYARVSVSGTDYNYAYYYSPVNTPVASPATIVVPTN